MNLKTSAADKNEKVKDGTLKRLIEESHIKFDLPEETKVSKGMVESRIRRGNTTKKIQSPMAETEPLLVDISVLAQRGGNPHNKREFINSQ